jgi:hypothetical protein
MFYRIQQPEHPVEWLLDPAYQYSTSYCTIDPETGEFSVRHGVSVCRSIEDLADYFAQAGVALSADCQLVEMAGDWADEDDEDEALGAYLVYPTEIVSVTDVDAFLDMVSDAYDRIAA